MKLFTAKQIQEWDAYTVQNEPISSYNLMERAVTNLYAQLKKHHDLKNKTVQIFCGSGNNGGDGLALARYLMWDNISVSVIYAGDIQNASPDNQKNYQIVQGMGIPIHSIEHIQNLPSCDYVVDALLGTGLNRSVEVNSTLGKAIEYINQEKSYVISIDIPSGLMSEDNRKNEGVWVKSDAVYSFQQPKIAYFLKEWAKHIGDVHIVDIGLHKEYYQNTETKYYALTEQVFQSCFKSRIKFSHKGTYGHCLLVGGFWNITGAGILAAKAAYRSGCGRLTVLSNQGNQFAFNVSVPEAMFCASKKFIELKNKPDFLQKFDSIGIGHGLGTNEKSMNLFVEIIQNYSKRMVIDADGITLLANNTDLWKHLQGKEVVLTPHIGEAERLLQHTFSNSLDRLEACQEFAKEKQSIIVLKDTITSIIFPDSRIYFSDNGCAGMAKGGTGDVLTGVISSLLAQKYNVQDAVLTGVYAHGAAAKKALANSSNTALMASDIIYHLFS